MSSEIKITADNVFSEIQKQIRKIEKFASRYSRELSKSYGITGPQIAVLRMISLDSAISLTELSRKMGLHITTVDGMVKRLHRRKLIQKKKRATDKRVVEVSIAARGREIINKAPYGQMSRFRTNLQIISDEEAQSLYDAMVRIVELYGASTTEM